MWGHPAQCWGHREDIHTYLLNKEVLAVPPDSGVSLAPWEPTRSPPAQFSEIPLHGSNLMRWLRGQEARTLVLASPPPTPTVGLG